MKELCLKADCASEKFYVKICIAFISTFLFIQCPKAQVPDATSSSPANGTPSLIFLSFTGKLITDNEVVLKWQTSGEMSESLFEIAWSSDSRNWQTVGTVAATNNNDISNYSWKCSQPSLINFYRLKMIDAGGKFTFSPVIRINGSDKAVVIYPNPAKNTVYLSTFSDRPETIVFINGSGKVLLRKTINEPVSSIDISKFAPGNYIIRIIRDNKSTVYQLVKE